MHPPDRGDAAGAPTLDIRPPEDEFRAHVLARTETLAKLGAGAGAGAARLELYAEALELGLARLREARQR